MRFPRCLKDIVAAIVLLNSCILFSQQSLLVTNDSANTYSFDTALLDQLVKTDSLYTATILLNEAINFSKQNGLEYPEAKAYSALGEVLAKMGNHQNAESYHLKAFEIYKRHEDKEALNRVYANMLDTYTLDKNYPKFDSLYPVAIALARSLKSELYYVNLENNVKMKYYMKDNEKLLTLTNLAINVAEREDFSTLNYSKAYEDIPKLRNRLLQSYKYHNAIAKIKLSDFKAEGFDLLFALDEDELESAFEEDSERYRKLATLNYYKYRYYTEAVKNLDSANFYLLKSDTFKYTALVDFEKRNSKNGELIYKIINTEQELNLANAIGAKDAKASRNLLYATIIISGILLTTLVIFYFYIKAKRNIQSINSKLKRSNEKLLSVDKDRFEFFSILSHELRTPIYGITGLATLVDQEPDAKKRQSYLDSLISSSNYLSILIDNILQVNKLRFEEKQLRLKPEKVSNIINHVVNTVKVAAKNKGLEIKKSIDSSQKGENILLDKVAFSQILINLVYNAIRYTKEGSVKISVSEKTRTAEAVTLRFEVSDTGIGIKPEHRSVVFSAFENKAFLNKNSSGSGLGLHIVKTLLKSHGSDIDFTSVPGKGTTFFFETTFALAVSPKVKTPVSIGPVFRDTHVLIVDDNKVNLLITQKNIEKIRGFSAETTNNGRQAISMVKDKDYDLILMDINMPDIDGYEATKHIRVFNPEIPILALTALNSKEISEKAEAAGINYIITKPYIFEDFKFIVRSYATDDSFYGYSNLATT